MSIHPSLSSSEKHKKQRSVLKRTERLKVMAEKNQWKIGDDVFGLPKIKTLKIKIKKEKTAEKAAEAGAEATAAAGTAAAPAKEQSTGKAAASKEQAKK